MDEDMNVEEVNANNDDETMEDSDFEDIDEDDDEEVEEEEEKGGPETSGKDQQPKKIKPKKAYLPGMKLKEDETLVCEESAYITLHSFTTTAPCLSFDIIPDSLETGRTNFPLTAYLIGGTQAERSHSNQLIVMKLHNVYKTQPKSSDDELSSDESENEEFEEQLTKKPDLTAATIPHHGCVNRVRFNFVNDKPLAASWSELGKVSIWDLSTPLKALENYQELQTYMKNKDKPKPLYSFKGHKSEGFAVDWSPVMPGVLATGDCTKFLFVWRPSESTWIVDQHPFVGHTASVEDIQWSPTEAHVFATCSVDKSIRIWDQRSKPSKGCMIAKEGAHEKDVNVIHWNRKDPFIVSGGDDFSVKIWDLRQFGKADSVAEFKHHHKAPVCSVEWSPFESTVLMTGGEDNQVAIWDLALERDPEQQPDEDIDVPPQLLFVHQGQQDIKEAHWHPQIPGVALSTSGTGFNIFKPANI